MSEASAAKPRRDYTILIIFYLLALLVFATFPSAPWPWTGYLSPTHP